jgi:hypothetical protein
MSTPAQVVEESFSQARSYATEHAAQLEIFLDTLTGSLAYEVPTIDITWDPLATPSGIAAPSRPAALDELEAEFEWDASGEIAATTPDALAIAEPTLEIDDFTEEAPEVTLPTAPTLTFPELPVLDYGDRPVVPEITEVTVPDAPTIVLPDTPSYLTLSTPTFGGLDLHEDYLEALEDRLDLTLVAPTPYTYTPGPEYASTLLTALQEGIEARLAGGTGLDPTVEAAIWDRARDREVAGAQAALDNVAAQSEALGYALPAGVVAEANRQAQRNYYDKVSTLSRDIALKQADLEQANLKHSIDQGMALESRLIEYSLQLERLAFESAKTVAENAVAIYNSQVQRFGVLVDEYRAYAGAYDTVIKGELAKVEVYRAQIAAEQLKAETNRTLVQQYEAEIRALLVYVEVYKAQVDGAKVRMELESARLAAAGEQIKAYVAIVNGETARLEAYKAGVQGQAARAEAYKTQVEAEKIPVDIYKVKADAFAAVAGAQAEHARALISRYTALYQAKGAEWDGWRSRVTGEAERFRALGTKSNAVIDGYRADIIKYSATIDQDVKFWEGSIKQYEAQQQYILQGAKLNTDIVQANRAAIQDAAKAGAQTYAQLTASAYSIIRASAGVDAKASNSVSWNYNNTTSSNPAPVTSV